MPRRAKGACLYLRASHFDKRSGKTEPKCWVIRDGATFRRTGCLEHEIDRAEQALNAYLAAKHTIERVSERRAAEIEVADVLSIYLDDVVSQHARPKETMARLGALNAFWGARRLSDVTGRACRAYAASRPSQASARRELEDLRSAINHHRREGLCSEIVSVVLPEKGEPRDRWLTRSEAARLIWAAYRYREVQKGHVTGRKSRQHVARFILIGLYTGTRAAAICGAAFEAGPGHGYLDLDRGVFYRRRIGAKETKKRQPPVRLPDRLLAHLRRWQAKTISKRFAVEFNGQPIGRINKAFARVAQDARLGPEVTPHVLRHTAATWMMHNGVPLKQAADFVGMTVEVLERVYAHAHSDFQKEAALGVSRRSRTIPHRMDGNKREQSPSNKEDR